MAISDKLTYLGETKSILKDTINMSNANITNSTTFRNYATQLKEGYIDILNNGTDTLYNNFTHLTGKGTTLSFAPTYQAPMKITCYGSTSQASTPTPSSPVDVVTTTGNQSINVCGKNLFDENKYLTATFTTGTYKYALANFKGNRTLYVKAQIKSGKTAISDLFVAFSTNGTNPNSGTSHFVIRYNGVNNGSIDFTGTNDLYVAYYPTTYTWEQIMEVYDIWVSTDDITYEAYNGTNYNIGLGNIELCKIGDYEDKIDKSTGKNFIDNANVIYNYSNVSDSYNTLTTINTGIRYKTTYNNGSPVVVFKSIDLTNYVGKTIRFKANFGAKGRITLALCNADVSSRTAIQASTTSGNTITYVVPNNLGEQKYLAYYLGIVGATGNDTEDFTNLIITIDNEDMTYEPYGTDWYLKKNIGKVVNEIAAIGTLSSGYVYGYKNALWNNKKIGKFGGICNKALFSTDRTPNTFYENDRNFAFVGDTNDTLETMQQKYNGADVYYVLETPTYTKITDSTLIEQLEAIKSKDNTTNITSSMVIGAIALKKE